MGVMASDACHALALFVISFVPIERKRVDAAVDADVSYARNGWLRFAASRRLACASLSSVRFAHAVLIVIAFHTEYDSPLPLAWHIALRATIEHSRRK